MSQDHQTSSSPSSSRPISIPRRREEERRREGERGREEERSSSARNHRKARSPFEGLSNSSKTSGHISEIFSPSFSTKFLPKSVPINYDSNINYSSNINYGTKINPNNYSQSSSQLNQPQFEEKEEKKNVSTEVLLQTSSDYNQNYYSLTAGPNYHQSRPVSSTGHHHRSHLSTSPFGHVTFSSGQLNLGRSAHGSAASQSAHGSAHRSPGQKKSVSCSNFQSNEMNFIPSYEETQPAGATGSSAENIAGGSGGFSSGANFCENVESSEKPKIKFRKTEYKAKFRPFSAYVYVSGNGFKKPKHLDQVTEVSKAKDWIYEVVERSQKALEFQRR